MAVTDPLLLTVLAENRTGHLKEITATIQTEQNALIREFDHAIILCWDDAYYHDQQNGNNRRYVAASRGTKTLTLVN